MRNAKPTKFVAKLLACIIFWPSFAPAQGGAGRCGLPSCDPMVTPAAIGTPEALMVVVETELDKEESSLPSSQRRRFRSDVQERLAWRNDRKKHLLSDHLRNGNYGTLLDYAVAAGNLGVVQFLLDSGVTFADSDQETIFHRCINIGTTGIWNKEAGRSFESKDVPLESRKKAMKMVLQRGGDLDALNRHGYAPLRTCRDQAILDFYIEQGADLTAGLMTLDFYIERGHLLTNKKAKEFSTEK